jgi:hypothetical protein
VQLAEAQNKRAESLIKTGAISIDTLDTRGAALGQRGGPALLDRWRFG